MSDGNTPMEGAIQNTSKTSPFTKQGAKNLLKPKISSLNELVVELPKDIQAHLESQYEALYVDTRATSSTTEEQKLKAANHLKKVLEAMKHSPSITTCRMNKIKSPDVQHLICELKDDVLSCFKQVSTSTTGEERPLFRVEKHPTLDDVIEIHTNDDSTDQIQSLSSQRFPPPLPPQSTNNNNNDDDIETDPKSIKISNSNSPSINGHTNHNKSVIIRRKQQDCGWPSDYKVVIVDKFCGEAVLRGSNIFVRGIIVADANIRKGEKVAVYAHLQQIDHENGGKKTVCTRGSVLNNYTGHCVFLGVGITDCTRAEMFSKTEGLGIDMTLNNSLGEILMEHNDGDIQKFTTRAGPTLPPFNNTLTGKMMLQNLPSTLVAHALNPQQKDVILDMCAAPGGKTSHLASLVGNDALIIALDRSRKKMVTARSFFGENNMGATSIVPLALDATKCVITASDMDTTTRKSVNEIVDNATPSPKDDLLNIEGFYPESFDRILLDPPCSALGLRPKLSINLKDLKALQTHASYQRKFVKNAVALLKPGGTMTYSTCTINSTENEVMVRHILDTYPEMELVTIDFKIGLPGLPGLGLNDKERSMVRRFDPSDVADTMGFFLAKFVKKNKV